MVRLKILCSVAASAVLIGCTSDVEQVREVEPGNTGFTQSLAREYRDFALFEADQMYDWPDADYFARKGMAAAEGQTVQPESLEEWDLPESATPDLQSGRARLAQALDAGARETAPEQAARAQGRFDCWVEQQEENHQAAHIAACREEFLAAMGDLELAMAPVEAPAVEPAAGPIQHRIFFEFDKYRLVNTVDGRDVVQEVLAETDEAGAPAVSLIGHADRAGPDDYNFGLSLRRADTVREALIEGGVPAGRITVSGRGEEDPLVPTEDGVPLQENRRVEVILQ